MTWISPYGRDGVRRLCATASIIITLPLLLAACGNAGATPAATATAAARTATSATLYVSAGDLFALRASDGAVRWRYPVTTASLFPPVAAADGTLYVSAQNALSALAASTRMLIWRHEFDDPSTNLGAAAAGSTPVPGSMIGVSMAAVADGMVFVGTGHRRFTAPAGAVNALDAGNGTVRWQFRTGDSVVAAPVVAGGIVYVASQDHTIYALHTADGSLIWRYQTTNELWGSPAVVGAAVYVAGASAGDEAPSVYALRAGDGTLLWHSRFPDRQAGCNAAPAVRDGMVYLGSSDHAIYALRAADGALAWRYETGAPIYSSPAVADGVVYSGSNDGWLYALRADSGVLLWRIQEAGMPQSPVVRDGTVYTTVIIPAQRPTQPNSGQVIAVNARDGAARWTFPVLYAAQDPLVIAP